MLLTTVALNDVFAFTFGKLIGGRKLLAGDQPQQDGVGRGGRTARRRRCWWR